MSGGHFNYTNDSAQSEIFGWSDKPRDVFEDREISELVWDVFQLIRDYDWYASGDTCEETYRESVRQFKQKWLTDSSVRRDHMIVKACDALRDELLRTLGRPGTEDP